jgi:hypothetical protein
MRSNRVALGGLLELRDKRDRFLRQDEIVTLNLEDSTHVVSENHFYKSEGYYALVRNEISGINTLPRSADVIDAYIVPICLEKAKLAGIDVCEWEVSYSYVMAPCIIYGLNYFATPGEFTIAQEAEKAKEIIKHVTNNGKYPFCYQNLKEGEEVRTANMVFGKTANAKDIGLPELAEKVYNEFKIPLASITYIASGERCKLSSLGPVRYTKLTKDEKKLLGGYLNRKWDSFEKEGS